MNRRTFLTASASAISAATIGALSNSTRAAAAEAQPSARRNRLAISTYSYWRFKDDSKLPIEECIRQAAATGDYGNLRVDSATFPHVLY